MGKLVLELKGKLGKSRPKAMMFAALCSDNKFVAKVLNEFPFKNVQMGLKPDAAVKQNLEDIAHYAILSLKDIPTGKGLDSVKKARPFLEGVTSLMFEDKDKLGLEDYCNAVLALRELQTLVLPEELVIDPNGGSEQGVKTFKVPTPGKKKDIPDATNFLSPELEKADQWAEKISKEGELTTTIEKKDADMVACAKQIIATINKDSFLKKKYGNQSTAFANWTAEQIYGCRPETIEAIRAIKLDEGLLAELFNQFVQNLAASNPNEFIRVLASIVNEDVVATTVETMLSSKEKYLPSTVVKHQEKATKVTVVPEKEQEEPPFSFKSIIDRNFERVFRGFSLNDSTEKRSDLLDSSSWWDERLKEAHSRATTTASLDKQKMVAAAAL